ncbi:DgyrCDS14709 [Dimorphilus gyrociliatus]|uniref:DgyrCDS14709 n=1 Tax=Dimorphilus gyrociliatus TaxID=2664684 RepID=A0A7I8WEI8_9ANNE|nr:DgyrCDS14709 [Dimorphilus gyrociliatus]
MYFLNTLGFADGKLINIANAKDHAASCKASSEFYNCENALDLVWQSTAEWGSNCLRLYCIDEWIEITFKRLYDIIDICLYQRTYPDVYLLAFMNMTLGSSNTINVHLNLYETCVLLTEIGKSVSKVKFQTLGSHEETRLAGFQSILIYAYDNETINEDLYYINIANSDRGATCNSSSGINCVEAINNFKTTYWLTQCPQKESNDRCQGHFINVTFAFPAKPHIFCTANSADSAYDIKSLTVTWSSNYTQTIQLSHSSDRQCWNYTGNSDIEYWIQLTIIDGYTTQQNALKTIDVFAKG